tara:strand:- start:28 stop:717 length:690 start_codon:yes stop_codon:yes gene_type:complete
MSKLINNTLTVLGRSTSLKTFCDAVQAIRKDKSITGKKAISLNSIMQFRLSEILNDDYYSYEMLISIVTRIGAYTQTERKQREKSVSLPVRDTDILSTWKYSNIETLKKNNKGELIAITSTDHKLPNGFFKGLKQFGYSTIETPKDGYLEYKILKTETVEQYILADLQKQREIRTSKSGGKILVQKPKTLKLSGNTVELKIDKESEKDEEIQEIKAMFKAMADKIAALG